MEQKGSVISDLFNMDVLFGILLGIALPFVLWVATQDIPVAVDKAPVQPDNVIHAYQELIAGILALIGAAGAVIAVTYQIRHAQEMENKRRERREYAAKKMLPHALTSLTRYAESCLNALRPGAEDEHSVLDTGTWELAPISDFDIEPIKQLLEFGERDIQDRLSELLLRLQIQQSHLRPVMGEDPQYWTSYTLAGAMEIHARAKSLYDYAQDGRAPGPMSFDDIRKSAGPFGWSEADLNDLRKRVGNRWN